MGAYDAYKRQDLVAKMNVLANMKHTTRVAAEIYGQKYLLDEYQVRALQILCKRAAEDGDDAWKEFTEKVLVYNTDAEIFYTDDGIEFDFTDAEGNEKTVHKMIFTKSGRFANEFTEDEYDNGFFTRAANLAFELF